VKPVVDRCEPPARRALRDASLEAKQLSGVILVGGATRMPIVRRLVASVFGREPLADIDPDEVVALARRCRPTCWQATRAKMWC